MRPNRICGNKAAENRDLWTEDSKGRWRHSAHRFQGILMVGERAFSIFTEPVVLLPDGIDCKAVDKNQQRYHGDQQGDQGFPLKGYRTERLHHYGCTSFRTNINLEDGLMRRIFFRYMRCCSFCQVYILLFGRLSAPRQSIVDWYQADVRVSLCDFSSE